MSTDETPENALSVEVQAGGTFPLAPHGGPETAPAPRRRWGLAIFGSLLIAALAAAPVWFVLAPKYRASALIRVAEKRQRILFKTADEETQPDFEHYRRTQSQFLKSRFVLIAALRSSDIAKLPSLRNEPDPVAWLARHLRVDFPGDGEIMEVSLAGDEPKELAALVNAVVDAYMAEVVDVERAERRQRLSDLDQIYAEKETEFRDKWSDLKVLAEDVGTGDTEAPSLKQQLVLDRFAALRNELMAVQFKRIRTAGEVKVKQQALQRGAQQPVSEFELDRFAQADPLILKLASEGSQLNQQLEQAAERGGTDVASKYEERLVEKLRETQRQIEARREQLRAELRRAKQAVIQEELAQLESETATLQEQERQLGQNVTEAMREAEAFGGSSIGGSSIDIEMLQAEIELLAGMLDEIAEQRQRLEIELRFPSQISVVQQAAVPASKDPTLQIPATAGAAVAIFLLSFCCISWWQGRPRRRT